MSLMSKKLLSVLSSESRLAPSCSHLCWWQHFGAEEGRAWPHAGAEPRRSSLCFGIASSELSKADSEKAVGKFCLLSNCPAAALPKASSLSLSLSTSPHHDSTAGLAQKVQEVGVKQRLPMQPKTCTQQQPYRHGFVEFRAPPLAASVKWTAATATSLRRGGDTRTWLEACGWSASIVSFPARSALWDLGLPQVCRLIAWI